MTGKGVVVKTDFKIATVRIRKSSACGHDCGECRACGGAEFLATVTNSVGAPFFRTLCIVIWFTVWFFAVRRISRRVKMSTILGVADEKD